MGKLFVPTQTLPPLDRIREALDSAESGLSNIHGSGSQVLQLLHLCDQISHELEDLAKTAGDTQLEALARTQRAQLMMMVPLSDPTS